MLQDFSKATRLALVLVFGLASFAAAGVWVTRHGVKADTLDQSPTQVSQATLPTPSPSPVEVVISTSPTPSPLISPEAAGSPSPEASSEPALTSPSPSPFPVWIANTLPPSTSSSPWMTAILIADALIVLGLTATLIIRLILKYFGQNNPTSPAATTSSGQPVTIDQLNIDIPV